MTARTNGLSRLQECTDKVSQPVFNWVFFFSLFFLPLHLDSNICNGGFMTLRCGLIHVRHSWLSSPRPGPRNGIDQDARPQWVLPRACPVPVGIVTFDRYLFTRLPRRQVLLAPAVADVSLICTCGPMAGLGVNKPWRLVPAPPFISLSTNA